MKSQDFEDFEYDVAIEIPDCPTSNIINFSKRILVKFPSS